MAQMQTTSMKKLLLKGEIQDLALALQVAQTTHILGMIQVFSLQKL
ncbi:hypothetical protein CIB84_008114 [Bambusicola thoracicus]|uniref:Uncharacterized protein n=1 Tax=Bambusicola thoracicus TaxID=9083 RepID=A0A2P4SVP4_BAMTH|nr:hypothetical protein CIB84_008114 [Bambusicola thoracicus]